MQKHLTFYIIYIQVVLTEHTQMCVMVELYTYCSMNKQYVEGIQNEKKAYLDGCR